MALLGLRDHADAQVTQFHAVQLSEFAKLSFYRGYANALMALLVIRVYYETISIHWLAIWLAAIVAIHVRSMIFDRPFDDVDVRKISRTDIIRQATTQCLSGIAWMVPALLFAPYGSAADLMALLIILGALTAGTVFFSIGAPLGVVGFIGFVLLAVVTHFLIIGFWLPAAATVLFGTICFFGVMEIARTHLAARMAEQGRAEKEQVVSLLLREFEENEADWLWEIDVSRRIRNVSPRFAFALACKQASAEGKPLFEMIAGTSWGEGQYPASLHELAENLKRRENFSNLIVQVKIRGEERWWELSGTPMRNDEGKFVGFRGVGSDVTEQRASTEKIAYLARFDTLTALPNRLQLTEALGDALAYAEQWRSRCALLILDLDRFKSVNDSLGHMVGDKLLAQVSSRLQKITGDNAICGRLGGDEFAIVIREVTSKDLVQQVALEVIAALSEPYTVDNHTLYVGASVGSAVGPRDGQTVEELMRNADLALYRAKDIGGGEHCRFEQFLHVSAEERRQLEVSLREALDRDELELHYQPVVDARSENIVSFEALVRWNSADHGFVSPGKFIPLAEDTRLIVPIGKWVMRKACMEARNWPEHVKVNVNVSPEQLLEPQFNQEVVEALAAAGLRPERLEIEVTESIFVRDASIARAALEQVMALGCSVALDDFGTGYSSLGYLRKLRFSTIKVDRTFVQGAAQGSSESLAIINAVVAMANSMKMTTTAEGVENEEEAELIRNLGCDKIQGFYFGRPMVKEDARRLFQPVNLKSA